MNIVIYARYSSDKQSEQSIEGQLNTCYEFAKRNNYTILGEYIDRALSGKTDSRPEFLKMVADSSKKQFQGVLVYQLDRFARNRYDSATYKVKLKKNGVRVLSARENISDDASGILVEGLLESMAEYYSVELFQKVQRGMKINAEKCLYNGGTVPLGYKIIDKKYCINAETAPVVKRIFEMYADGSTVAEIANYLNKRQIKTATGASFNKNSLHCLLKNKKYIGVYIYDKQEVENGVPRIVSDELFNEVAYKLAKNRKAPARARAKVEYFLTTKLFCGHCKSLMTGFSGTSKTGKKYNYYGCNTARNKKCAKKNVAKLELENHVVNKCRKLLTDKNISVIAKEVAALCEQESNNPELKRLRNAVKKNEKQTMNLMESLKICEIESVKQSIFEELAKMDTQKKDLIKAVAKEEVQKVGLEKRDIVFFLTQLKKGDINDVKYRRTLINIFVNAIYLYDTDNGRTRISMVLNVGDREITVDEILLNRIEQGDTDNKSSCMFELGPPKKTAYNRKIIRCFLCG